MQAIITPSAIIIAQVCLSGIYAVIYFLAKVLVRDYEQMCIKTYTYTQEDIYT